MKCTHILFLLLIVFCLTCCEHEINTPPINDEALSIKLIVLDTLNIGFSGYFNIIDFNSRSGLMLIDDEILDKMIVCDLKGKIISENSYFGDGFEKFNSPVRTGGFVNDSVYMLSTNYGYYSYKVDGSYIDSWKRSGSLEKIPSNKKMYFSGSGDNLVAIHTYFSQPSIPNYFGMPQNLWPYEEMKYLSFDSIETNSHEVVLGLPAEYNLDFFRSFFELVFYLESSTEIIVIFNPLKRIYRYSIEDSISLLKSTPLEVPTLNNPELLASSPVRNLISSGKFERILSDSTYYYVLYQPDPELIISEEKTDQELVSEYFKNYSTSLLVLTKDFVVKADIDIPKEYGFLRLMIDQRTFAFSANQSYYDEEKEGTLYKVKLLID